MNQQRNEQRYCRYVLMIVLIPILLLTAPPSYEAHFFQKDKRVKNVIFMIPDGFSTSYATNYRLYKGEEAVWDSLLVGMHRTYSADSTVTDSAAAATAMATGVKTNNGMIGMSPDGKKLTTILEAAKDAGKKTGLIATSTITYATPAAFAAHVETRLNEKEIAAQLVQNQVDVMLGGGRQYFPNSLKTDAEKAGYTFISNLSELESGIHQKIIGLFAEEAMAPELDRDDLDQPSVSDMTKAALDVLSQHKNGFFLMVEGSQIDWAGHANDAGWAMKDLEAFEDAVETVIRFAEKDKNTLVIIAGDHDSGGMSVGGYEQYDTALETLHPITASGQFIAQQLHSDHSNIEEVIKQYTQLILTEEEIEQIVSAPKKSIAINQIISKRALVGWTTIEHTGVDIPVYAYGPKSDLFQGLLDNTALPKLMAKAMQISFPMGNE